MRFSSCRSLSHPHPTALDPLAHALNPRQLRKRQRQRRRQRQLQHERHRSAVAGTTEPRLLLSTGFFGRYCCSCCFMALEWAKGVAWTSAYGEPLPVVCLCALPVTCTYSRPTPVPFSLSL